MKLQARLLGGPRDGDLVDLRESVPYELTALDRLEEVTPANINQPVPISIYRRRGGLNTITLDEPVVYVFVGPAKRGSKR